MTRLHYLAIMSFIQTLAAVFMQRGCFFYTNQFLDFTFLDNLYIALGFGGIYIVGARLSHPVANRVTEKKLLLFTVFSQLLCAVIAGVLPTAAVVVAVCIVTGFLQGMMWPLYESYISAGHDPKQTARAVGYFNFAWTLGVPAGMVLVGVVNDFHQPSLLFVTWAIFQCLAIGMILRLEAKPTHLPEDHPDRASAEKIKLFRALMFSSRTSLLSSYAMIYILSALLPSLLEKLGLESETMKTTTASILDWTRFLTCIVMLYCHRWHGRRDMLAIAAVGLPLSFLAIYFAPNLAVCMAGEIVFGILVALAYNAALYYAMVVQNASVDAGGQHEAIIGAGFVVGPTAAICGATVFSTPMMVLVPFFVVCAAAGLWPLWTVHKQKKISGPGATASDAYDSS